MTHSVEGWGDCWRVACLLEKIPAARRPLAQHRRRVLTLAILLYAMLLPRVAGATETFAESFSNGLPSCFWSVSNPQGLYTVNHSLGDLRLSKPAGGVLGTFQAVNVNFSFDATGDFDVSVSFRDASITRVNGAPANQIQLNAVFGGQYFAVVRDDTQGIGNNAHVYEDPPQQWRGQVSTSATAGTLRIVRTGTTVDGYYNGSLLHSGIYNNGTLTSIWLSLQNNGTTDPTAVTFDDFSIIAGDLVGYSQVTTVVWNPSTNGSPYVSFQDNTPGATAWRWDFGDGSTPSYEQNPRHFYDLCRTPASSFTVRHWAGFCEPNVEGASNTVTLQYPPAEGSAGKAYVVIADNSYSDSTSADVVNTYTQMDSGSVNKAVTRLTASGYDVQVLGSLGAGVLKPDVQSALMDPALTAIVWIGHGNSQMVLPLEPNPGDTTNVTKWITPSEIAALRAGRQPLQELRLYTCDSGQFSNLRSTWNVSQSGVVFSSSWKTFSFLIALDEILSLCDEPLEMRTDGRERPNLVSQGASGAGSITPLKYRSPDGILGDDLYGAVAGAVDTLVADVSGEISFGDQTVGMSGSSLGHSPGDTAYVWMSRYSTTPEDTEPNARAILDAFIVRGNNATSGAELVFGYVRRPVSASLIEVWRFDDAARTYVRLTATVDSIGHTVTVSTDRWGTFVLTGPASIGAPYLDVAFLGSWGGYAAADTLLEPWDVCATPQGTLLVASSRIKEYDQDGNKIRQFAGSCGMRGIVVASDESFFASAPPLCPLPGGIVRYDPNGNFDVSFGSSGTGNGQVNGPLGLALNLYLYVCDSGNHRVERFTPSGIYSGQWGSFGTDPGEFYYPQYIAVDDAGLIYVTDRNDHIQVFRENGFSNYSLVRTIATQGSGAGQLSAPSGIQVVGGHVYVADAGNSRIAVFDLLGNWVGAWGTHGTGPGQFNAINGIAVTDSGTIFVADRGANQIKKFHVNISTAIATSVSESVPPGRSLLSQNRPNPFNPSTAIPFSLAGMGRVRIDIYDVQGRHIKTLVDRVESAGPHEALWQGDSDAGSRVGSGVYFYRMVFPNGTSGARRMILLR